MTMIGPARPKQTCPTCEGEGYVKAGERQEWHSSSSLFPYLGEYVTVSTFATCDTCGGEGVVTKKHLKQLQVPLCSICKQPAAALLFDFPICERCHAAVTSDVDICFGCHAILGEGEEVFCSECDSGEPEEIDWEAELENEIDSDLEE